MAVMYLKTAGGNWTAAGTWSATGAGGGDSAGPPVASTDCIAELLSGNVTIDSGAVCRSFDTTSGTGSYGGTITHNAITLNIGDATAGAGNVAIKLNAGLTYTLVNSSTSAVSFISTSATQQTITSAGKTFGNIVINGAGSSYILSDNLATTGNVFTKTNGALDTTTGSRTLTLSGTNVTFTGGSATYYQLDFPGVGNPVIAGTNTFTNLSRTGTSAKTDGLVFNANQTVTGVFTITGFSLTSRLLITSNTKGTARTITNSGATMTWSNFDVRDITLGTAYDASAVSSGDAGGNTNFTFTPAVTRYWIGGTGNWDSTGEWATSSGGGSGASVPLVQDAAIFDANSFSAGSQTVTQNQPRIGSMNWTGVTNTPTLTTSTSTSVFGSITLVSGMTLTASTQTYTLEGRSTYTLTSGTKTWSKNFNVAAPGGTWQLGDDFVTSSSSVFTLDNGTFDDNDFNFTSGTFDSSNSNVRAVVISSITSWSLTGNNATIWTTATATNFTITRGNPVLLTYSGAVGTRNFRHGNSIGATEANSPDISVTAGTDTVNSTTGSTFRNLSYSGFTGTLSNIAITVYGNYVMGSGVTITPGASAVTFAATSGTKTITGNGVTLDFPLTFNGSGGTFQLADNVTVGATRTVTLTNGTLDANNFNFKMGLFSSSNANTRTILMGTGTWELTGTGVVTVWTVASGTFNVTPSTSTIKISGSSASIRTFAGGGKTYGNIWITNATTGGETDITGSNTFLDFKQQDATPQTIKFTSGTTTTVTTWSAFGTAGNLLTINSTAASPANLVKSGGGTISSDYLSITYSAASPALTWYAGTHSTDVVGNSGWIFTAPPGTGGSSSNMLMMGI